MRKKRSGKLIRKAIGTEPYAEYIYCLCYLGFRPSEFLALKKSDCYTEGDIRYLVGGSKTEAGIDRTVVIPQQIGDIIDKRLSIIGTDLLFPMVCHNRKGEFTGYKLMTHNYFNNFVFKPLMARLGVSDRVPYSARHTYADKLKKASGDAKDKAALIGHSDYDFTQHRYQSAPLEDLKAVVDSIK
jgi:integrase